MKFISELNEINHEVYQRIEKLAQAIYFAKQCRHDCLNTGKITDVIDVRIITLQLEQDFLININFDLAELERKERANND